MDLKRLRIFKFSPLKRNPFQSASTQHSHSKPSPEKTPLQLENQDLIKRVTSILSNPSLDSSKCKDIVTHLSPQQFDSVFSDIRYSVKPRTALNFIYFASRSCGFKFTVRSYCLLIHLLVASKLEAPARLLLIQLIDDKLPVLLHDPQNKHIEIATAFVDFHFTSDSLPVQTFDLLVHVYCTQFKPSGLNLASDVVRLIAEKGLFPSLTTCNFLLNSLVKSNLLQKSHEIFNILRIGVQPDVYLFTTAINALCKDLKIKDAMTILSQMEEIDVSPNVVTYNSIIHGLCKIQNLQEAFHLKEKMIKKGVTPSLITYSVLINGLLKMENYNEAGKVLIEMTSNGFVPNEVLYNTLINGYCKLGDMKKAIDLKTDMSSKGINPNSVTFNTLIKGFCNTNQFEQAEKILEEMLSLHLTINAGSFTSIIHWLCKLSIMDSALRFVNEMLLRDLKPNDSLLTTIITELCKKGKYLEAVNLWFKLHEKRFFSKYSDIKCSYSWSL